MDDYSSSPSNNTIGIVDAFTISLASLSTIACIIALVVLIYFKLYRSFIYRLVFYSFLTLILLSLSITATTISFETLQENGNIITLVISMLFYLFYAVSLSITSLLATIINLCICILALFNHQFTYRADIVLLIFSLPLVVVSLTILIFIAFLVNVFLTVLTLVPLCSRACGYNMCVKTVRTKESHRKALKEILPLLILPLPSYIPSFLLAFQILFIINQEFHAYSNIFTYSNISNTFKYSNTSTYSNTFNIFTYSNTSTYSNITYLIHEYLNIFSYLFSYLKIVLLVSGTLGLITALSFALHLCFIGKTSLYKQRGRNRTPQADYGTANQRHTRHTTVYTMRTGASETCNTEYPYVSEGEDGARYLAQRNNQQ